MGIVELGGFRYKFLVAGVEFLLRWYVHPVYGRRIVAGGKLEFADAAALFVVEVDGYRLHPGIVCVAWIIDITPVNL